MAGKTSPSLCFVILVLVGCLAPRGIVAGEYSAGTTGRGVNPADPCGAEGILFHVAKSDGPMLPGARVQLISGGEILDLGTTDSLGQICLSEERIFQEKVQAVLFCRDNYYCGAFVPKSERRGFRERFIALAPRENI